LVAGVSTRNLQRAFRFARNVDAGQVFINEYSAGGNKKSGVGREKGLEALRNYCKIKSVVARI
jgi:aldehyde dehydrogenase (NAD+)/betaine-aldehyde dehydrogenase